MKYLSVCSGIEAATVAWHPLGWKPFAFAEIEAFPSALLAHHYPNVPNLGDITKFKEWPDGAIDVLVGGTPCQSFSVAGLRKGLDDPRGNLALTFLAIAERYRPRWVVWENVPGVLSSNGGRDFGAFLGGLVQLGYGFAYRVLDAQYFGVPQRRRRVFVVGCLGDWRSAAAALFERESLRGNPAPRREAGEAVAPCLEAGANRSGGTRPPGTTVDTSTSLIPTWPADVAPTLNAAFGSKQGLEDQHALGGGGCLSLPPVSMCLNAGAMGRRDAETETLIPTTGAGFDVAHTLKGEGFDASEDGTGRGTPLVPVAFGCKDSDPARSVSSDLSPTLRAMGHTGSHANAGGQVAVAFAQNSRDEVREMPYVGALAAEPGMKQTSYIRESMAVRRLTPRECERLQGFSDDYTLIPWKSKRPRGEGGPCAKRVVTASLVTLKGQIYQATNYVANPQATCPRGTMPTGDGYELCRDVCQQSGHAEANVLKIAGKNAEGGTLYLEGHSYVCDECKGALLAAGVRDVVFGPPPGNAPDGPRYKALGNSMAVPVMRWIGERIESVEAIKAAA